jgi:hypothetical protein
MSVVCTGFDSHGSLAIALSRSLQLIAGMRRTLLFLVVMVVGLTLLIARNRHEDPTPEAASLEQ